MDVLRTYVQSTGMLAFFMSIVSFLIYSASEIGVSLWLAAWSDDPVLNGTEAKQQSDYRLTMYGIFGIFQGK